MHAGKFVHKDTWEACDKTYAFHTHMESLVTFETYITSHLPEVMGVVVPYKENNTVGRPTSLLSLYYSVPFVCLLTVIGQRIEHVIICNTMYRHIWNLHNRSQQWSPSLSAAFVLDIFIHFLLGDFIIFCNKEFKVMIQNNQL